MVYQSNFSMLSCSTYFRHTVRSLLADLQPAKPLSTLGRTYQPLTFLYPREASTLQGLRKGHHRKVLRDALSKKTESGIGAVRRRRNGPLPAEVRDVLARENNRRHLSIEDKSISADTQFQLQWLRDPLKLSNAVTERLRLGADKQALELILGSEQAVYVNGEKIAGQANNVVSWNHMIEYYMQKGDIKEALKIYNQMKKRGHRPDAHAYTILLKGFAKNLDKPNAVDDAISVYNSIFAPNSAVKPNTIHTNAIINVCARARDMDKLWAIAGRLPERGAGAADNITYTSILNAIRTDAEARSDAFSSVSAQYATIIEDAVRDGERLWVDVNMKLRAGEFMVDEPLTCAMGRLLLLGHSPRNWNNVFSLVEQTMRLPTYENSQRERNVASSDTLNFKVRSPENESTEISNVGFIRHRKEAGDEEESLAIDTCTKPSNNTISMLLQAAILTRNMAAGKYYWDILTSSDGPYRIAYDFENMSQYLRLLRVSRSSKLARDLLCQDFTEKQAAGFLLRGNFIIAMSICVRDKHNPNVFDIATDIFELMQRHLPDIDAKVMEMYLEIAIVTTPGFGYKAGLFDPNPSTNNTMRLLARYETVLPEIKDMLMSKLREEQYDALSSRRQKKLKDPRDGPKRVYQSTESLASLLNAIKGAYDRIIAQTNMPESLWEDYLRRQKRISAFITKIIPHTEPKRRADRLTPYSERESGAQELENQEQRFDERARGFKGPRKYHGKGSTTTANSPYNQRRSRDEGLAGWGGGFDNLMKQQGSTTGREFLSLGS